MAVTIEEVRSYARTVLQLDESSFPDADVDEHVRQAWREVVGHEDWEWLYRTQQLAAPQGRDGAWLVSGREVRRINSVWVADGGGREDRQLVYSGHAEAIREFGWDASGGPQVWSWLPAEGVHVWPKPDPDTTVLVAHYVSEPQDWPPRDAGGRRPAEALEESGIPDGLMSAVMWLTAAHGALQKGDPDLAGPLFGKARRRLEDRWHNEHPTADVAWSRGDRGGPQRRRYGGPALIGGSVVDPYVGY